MVLTARRHRGIRLQPFMVRRSGALIGRCSRSERHSAKSATYGCAGSRSQALRASRLYRARTARRSTSRSPAATASEPPYPKFWPALASFEPSEVGRGGLTSDVLSSWLSLPWPRSMARQSTNYQSEYQQFATSVPPRIRSAWCGLRCSCAFSHALTQL